MLNTTALIIGGGQCGLAMSHALSQRSIDHTILESGRVGESWRSRRWDSLRLLSPNWKNRLAGVHASTHLPDDFMSARDFACEFDHWIDQHAPPLIEQASVSRVTRHARGFLSQTDQGPIQSRTVVLATGACARPKIPAFSQYLPTHIDQLWPTIYRNPAQLASGRVLIVGASASGLQIARELALAGFQVTLAAGSHLRMPRRYRGADIMTWLDLLKVHDQPYTEVDDLQRVRRTPSLPLIGLRRLDMLDVNLLRSLGVEVCGRMADVRRNKALFSGSLANVCKTADLKLNRLLNQIDTWIKEHEHPFGIEAPVRFKPTAVPDSPALSLDLDSVGTVIWATGFKADHRFVDIPVFDRKDQIQHQGGVVEPGLYVTGLPFLRTARSVHIDGALCDAEFLAGKICEHLDHTIAA